MATKQSTVRSAVVWRHTPLSWAAGLPLAGGDVSQPACRAVIRNLIDTWRMRDRSRPSVCATWFVTPSLDVLESVGFYEPPSTTGEALARMMEDAMLRLGLSMDDLRGLAFDWAANMKGQFGGSQALLRAQQSLALYVHCGAHYLNLVAKDSTEASALIRNALHAVNELGVLFTDSIKLRGKFEVICQSGNISTSKLRPLCPTRWTFRLQAVSAVLDQYSEVLQYKVDRP